MGYIDNRPGLPLTSMIKQKDALSFSYRRPRLLLHMAHQRFRPRGHRWILTTEVITLLHSIDVLIEYLPVRTSSVGF